jgi:hypothetical protein
MFHPLMFAFTALLFIALTPGILVTLPPKSTPIIVAVTHGILFALIYAITHKAVRRLTKKLEGFQEQYVFPPAIKNGDICKTQTCMCNGAEIAEAGRCQ